MKLTKSDFSFYPAGHGRYSVIYYSPKTNKAFMTFTHDMELIDATKNTENPKQKDLKTLKRICKS